MSNIGSVVWRCFCLLIAVGCLLSLLLFLWILVLLLSGSLSIFGSLDDNKAAIANVMGVGLRVLVLCGALVCSTCGLISGAYGVARGSRNATLVMVLSVLGLVVLSWIAHRNPAY
jgi:hypothetical protein